MITINQKTVVQKLVFIVLLSFILLFALSATASAQSPPDKKGRVIPPFIQNDTPVIPPISMDLLAKIEPQLLKKLLTTDKPLPFIIYLKSTTATALTVQSGADKLSRRTAIVNNLKQTARDSQADLLQFITGGVSVQGQNISLTITDIKPLWIINAVAAKGSLEAILTLAKRPDVQTIELDKVIKLGSPPILSPSFITTPTLQIPGWNITEIRADLVHNALGFDGAGVVVANIDTGVDWQHPALQSRYKGYTGVGKIPLHTGNWHDSTGAGSSYPIDGNGHGTHTMGTILGGNGIGVAPAAKWIAVKAFDSSGNAQFSWIHDAFQWILAPNGNPALAPDIVNNSWGDENGANLEFEADVQALLSAGIFPVFSAGNSGPSLSTINSPGSLGIAFSVGATTIDGTIAGFSSRGPSTWGDIKPDVSAPGKNVFSSLPGGTYSSLSGTSMAAPHVAGLAALLLQANPGLTVSQISKAISSNSSQFGSPIPNNNYGWGRIDAYNAIMSVSSSGTIRGQITEVGGNWLIVGATINFTTRTGAIINNTSNTRGVYNQGLATGNYDVTAFAFGYNSVTAFNIPVIYGQTITQNFSLPTKNIGTLVGTVSDANGSITATISIDGTPSSVNTNARGNYSLNLPIGVYTVTVKSARHRITRTVNVAINDGAIVTRNFILETAPAILLVDSGKAFQTSQIIYYQQALDSLFYPYDTWQIAHRYIITDLPTIDVLLNYDIVIWSAPFDSPSLIRAEGLLKTFLNLGGRLFISGQDIAYFDGSGYTYNASPYFTDYLKASFVADNSGVYSITGTIDSPFAGLSLGISGGDGANNQSTPDVIKVRDSNFAAPAFYYTGSEKIAGLYVGTCVSQRAIFLAFGFEAINSQAARVQVMERTINWLMQTPATVGVELIADETTTIGSFGTDVSHVIRLRNTGTKRDNYNFSLDSDKWPVVKFPPTIISLPSCGSYRFSTLIKVDTNLWHASNTLTITAHSTINLTLTTTITQTSKSPAPVLLVDDDRWPNSSDKFKAALESNNIPYDYWYVAKSWSGPIPPSPPLETLQLYPMTVWYTGYDWLNPLLTAEEERLDTYLDGGGRLFFSSQDYIYNLPDRKPSQFAQNYLGVQAHIEDYQTTIVRGQKQNPVGSHLGSYTLTFPSGYDDWTDSLTPTVGARVATINQDGLPNGIINAGVGSGGNHWRTMFLSYGPELLPATGQAELMKRSVGWLSWLGSSTVEPTSKIVLAGSTVAYTTTIINDGWADLTTASFTATFPAELKPVSNSAGLTALNGNLVWNGALAKNKSKIFTYTVAVSSPLPYGTALSQTVWLGYPEHNILFDRVSDLYVNFPNLKESTVTVDPIQNVGVRDILTYTIRLKNSGLVDTKIVTVVNSLSPMLDLISIDSYSKGAVVSADKTITWTTTISKNETVLLTYRAKVSYRSKSPIINSIYINDNLIDPINLTAQTTFKMRSYYLPVIYKN